MEIHDQFGRRGQNQFVHLGVIVGGPIAEIFNQLPPCPGLELLEGKAGQDLAVAVVGDVEEVQDRTVMGAMVLLNHRDSMVVDGVVLDGEVRLGQLEGQQRRLLALGHHVGVDLPHERVARVVVVVAAPDLEHARSDETDHNDDEKLLGRHGDTLSFLGSWWGDDVVNGQPA